MDSDDIAVSDRFEKQLTYMETHPECDVVGGQITEFIDDESNIAGRRTVPQNNDDIYKYIKSHCPFNHVTVMLRKNRVLNIGNYQDWHYTRTTISGTG